MISVVILSVLAVFASSSSTPSDPFQNDCSCPIQAPASECSKFRCLGTKTSSRTPIVGSCVDNTRGGCKCAEVTNGAATDLIPALCGKCCDIQESLGQAACTSVYCKAAVMQNNMKRCVLDGAQKCSCGSPSLESCPTTSTTADPTTSTSTTKTTTTKTTTTRATTTTSTTTGATTTTASNNCCSIVDSKCVGQCTYRSLATGAITTSGCIGDSQKCDCRIPTLDKLIAVEKKCKCCDAKDYYTCTASTCSAPTVGSVSSCKWSSGACMCANGVAERGCPATSTTSSPPPQCRSCKARFLASGVCGGKCYYREVDSATGLVRKGEGKCVSGITKCECRKADGSLFSPNLPFAVEQCACCEATTAAQCRVSQCVNPLVTIGGEQVSQPHCSWDSRLNKCSCANRNGEPTSICDPTTATPTTTADPTTTAATSTTEVTSVTSTRTTNDGVCGCPAYTASRPECTSKNCVLMAAAGITNTLVQCELTGKTVSDPSGGAKYECICPARRLNAQAAPCDCCGMDERLCKAGTCSKPDFKGAGCVWDSRASQCYCRSTLSSSPTADNCPTTTTTKDPRTTPDPTTTTSDPRTTTTTSATSDPGTTTTRTTHPPPTSDGVCGCPDRLASGDKCERYNCDVVKLGLSTLPTTSIKQCQTSTTTVNGVTKTSCVCPTFQNTYLPKPCDCCGRTQQLCELGECSKNSNARGGRCKWKSTTSGSTVSGECVCIEPGSSAEIKDNCPTSSGTTTTKDPNHTTRTDKTTTTRSDRTTTKTERTTTKSDRTTTRDGSQTTTTKNPNQSTATKDPNQQTTRMTTKDPGSQTTTRKATDAATTKDPVRTTTTKTDRTTTRSDKTTTSQPDRTTTSQSKTTTVKPDTTTKDPARTTTTQRGTVVTRPCQDPAPTAPVITLCNCPKQKDANRPCTDYQTKVQGFLTNNYPSTYYARCETDSSSAGDCKPPSKYTVTTNGNSQTIDVKPVPCTCCGITNQRRCVTTGVVVSDSTVSTCKYWKYCAWTANADGTGKCDNPKPLASCANDRPPTPNNPTTTTAAPVLFIVVVKGQISCSLNPVRTTGEPALTTTRQVCSMPFKIAIRQSFGTNVKGAYYIGIEVCKKDPSKTSATDITITYYIVCSSESQIEQIKKLVNGWLTRYQTLQDLFLKYTNQALVCKADAAPQCYERSSTGVVSSTAGTGKCKALLNVLTSASPRVRVNAVVLMIIVVFGMLV